jgi:hypothetical protein
MHISDVWLLSRIRSPNFHSREHVISHSRPSDRIVIFMRELRVLPAVILQLLRYHILFIVQRNPSRLLLKRKTRNHVRDWPISLKLTTIWQGL